MSPGSIELVLAVLLAALIATAPEPVCVTWCSRRTGVLVCYYDAPPCPSWALRACPADAVCEPRVKELGSWNPIPLDYEPARAYRYGY